MVSNNRFLFFIIEIYTHEFHFNFFHSQLSSDAGENYAIEVTDTSTVKLFEGLPFTTQGGNIYLSSSDDAIAMMEEYQATLGRGVKKSSFSKTLRNKIDKTIREKAIKFFRYQGVTL